MTGQPTTPPPQSSHKALVRETNGYSLRLLICSVKTPCFVCSSWCCWLPGRCCCRGCQSSSMDAATWVAWSHNDGRLVWARHWVSWSHQWTSFLLEMNWFASPARNSFLEIPSVISEVKNSQLMSVISCNFCLKTIFEASIFFWGGSVWLVQPISGPWLGGYVSPDGLQTEKGQGAYTRWTPPFLPAALSDWLETLHRTVLQCTVVGNIEPAILGQLQAAPYLQICLPSSIWPSSGMERWQTPQQEHTG